MITGNCAACGFLRDVLDHPRFRAAGHSTTFIESL
jgi:hypothetical protein